MTPMTIILTRGETSLVDPELYEGLNQYSWKVTDTGYACRSLPREDNRRPTLYLHVYVVELCGMSIPEGHEVDHINRNRLDNRKENLRVVTKAVNRWNQSSNSRNLSSVRGVCWCKQTGKWRVQVGKTQIGRFDTLEEAKEIRDNAAKRLRGTV